MSAVAQWRAIRDELPEEWDTCSIRLAPTRPEDGDHIARLLGPASPGRAGDDLVLDVTRRGATGTAAIERLLARLDSRRLALALELTNATTAPAPEPTWRDEISLQAAWDELVEALPDDWSDLLCLVELRSSDELDPAALELSPLNPSRHGNALAFRFRVARQFGYGAAPQMARRCLARLDERELPGTLVLLEAFAGSRPVLTQGPTFAVGSRAV
jgi:hypothetical protein